MTNFIIAKLWNFTWMFLLEMTIFFKMLSSNRCCTLMLLNQTSAWVLIRGNPVFFTQTSHASAVWPYKFTIMFHKQPSSVSWFYLQSLSRCMSLSFIYDRKRSKYWNNLLAVHFQRKTSVSYSLSFMNQKVCILWKLIFKLIAIKILSFQIRTCYLKKSCWK